MTNNAVEIVHARGLPQAMVSFCDANPPRAYLRINGSKGVAISSTHIRELLKEVDINNTLASLSDTELCKQVTKAAFGMREPTLDPLLEVTSGVVKKLKSDAYLNFGLSATYVLTATGTALNHSITENLGIINSALPGYGVSFTFLLLSTIYAAQGLDNLRGLRRTGAEQELQTLNMALQDLIPSLKMHATPQR